MAEQMVAYLGCIGHNQYHTLPDKVSKKVSYPLPRDIIARTLGRMHPDVLPVLLKVLAKGSKQQIAEVLDAICRRYSLD